MPLEIDILPHFYQAWWWYTLLALASSVIILVVYNFRLVTIRRRYAALFTERRRERSRLARELHDTLANGMAGIHIQIEAAQVLLDVNPSSIRKHLENVERIAREASLETRKAITALRSECDETPAFQWLLEEAASRFSRSSNIPLITHFSEEFPQFSREVNHEIFRFVEEALTNVRLHSAAQHAYLTAHTSAKVFVLEVRDDGKGFEVGASRCALSGHFGLTGMKERARRISGRIQIISGLGRGTHILLEVPLRTKWKGATGSSRLATLFRTKQFYIPLPVRLRAWLNKGAFGKQGPFDANNA